MGAVSAHGVSEDERVVLRPELTYAELAGQVEARGWVWHSGPTLPPLVAGEPELSAWRHPTAGDLVYTCNPVAWLRLLDLAAVSDPAERIHLLLGLPLLESEDIGPLLRSASVEEVLLGVHAAAVLGLREHARAVRALMHHRDPAVARAATTAVTALA